MRKKKPIDHICEKAFSGFLDSEKYDEAEEMLFTVIRQAFFAGWEAAEKNKFLVLPVEKKE